MWRPSNSLLLVIALCACGQPAAPHEPISNRVPTEPSGTGTIEVTVVSARTAEKLAGVTVIATTMPSAGAESAITDENGHGMFTLERGDWLLTFYYGDVTLEHPHVRVNAGLTTKLVQMIKE